MYSASQSLYFLAPLSPTETTFSSFIFCLSDSHPGSLPCSPVCVIPLLPSPLPLHSPVAFPIIKTILPFRSCLLLSESAFHRKVLSLPWICSINSKYLASNFYCSLTNGNVRWFASHSHYRSQKSKCHTNGPIWIFFQATAELLITLI